MKSTYNNLIRILVYESGDQVNSFMKKSKNNLTQMYFKRYQSVITERIKLWQGAEDVQADFLWCLEIISLQDLL
jgi:hypothetical protein